MKQLVWLSIMILCHTFSFSQNNCDNQVSTDPLNPINNSLPYNSSYPNNEDIRFLNYFDWATSNDIQLNNMSSVYQYPMTHLKFPGSAPYYSYIYDGEDLTPANGWELVLFNIGQYPNGSNYVPTGMQDIPFIVLYNKYTGILRVFATYGSGLLENGLSFDGVVVSVVFDNPEVNGILRLRNGNDVALDKETEAAFTQALAFHPNSPSKWFSCDFQLAYDPCICYFPSKLRLKFDFLESLQLTLYGRSITVEDDMADGNNLLTNNFLTNFRFDGTNSEDQIIMYKVMDDFVDDYLERLNKYKTELANVQEYNKEIERKLVIVNMFKKVVIDGGSAAISSITGMPWFSSVINFGLDLVHEDGASAEEVKKVKDNITKEAKKAFASGVETYIKKSFEKKTEPNKPGSPPTAAFTEMRMEGEISNSTPIWGPSFFTPGTYGSEGTGSPVVQENWQYPVYNNANGIFALLNSPKVKILYKNEMVNEFEYVDQYWINNKYSTWDRSFQLKLDGPLYYVINSAADIKSYDINIGFEIEDKIEGALTGNIDNAYLNPNKTVNFNSDDVNSDEYYPVKVFDGKGFNNGKNYCDDTYGDCEYEENNIWTNNVIKDTIKLSSDLFPADALQNIVFGASLTTQNSQNEYFSSILPDLEGWYFNVEQLKLKILIDVVHNGLDDDGQNITSTHMFTYTIDGPHITSGSGEFISNLNSSSYNIMQYEQNLVFHNVNFDGSNIPGCQLYGYNYSCQAIDQVDIFGNLTTSQGYHVDIFAGNELNVNGESSVSPEIVLAINPIFDLSNPMPIVDLNFLEGYCKNELGNNLPGYLANTLGKSTLDDYQNFVGPNVGEKEKPFEMNVYPIPSKEHINIVFSKTVTNAEFMLFDLTGRQVQCTVFQVDKNRVEINFGKIEDGVYTLITNCNEGRFNNQILVLQN